MGCSFPPAQQEGAAQNFAPGHLDNGEFGRVGVGGKSITFIFLLCSVTVVRVWAFNSSQFALELEHQAYTAYDNENYCVENVITIGR